MRSRYVLRTGLNYYEQARDQLLKNDPRAAASVPSFKDSDPAQEKVKREQVVHWLEGELKAEFLGNSEILSLSLSGDNPEEIRLLVDGVKDAYLKEVVESERAEKQRELEIKTKAYDGLRTKLVAAQGGTRLH